MKGGIKPYSNWPFEFEIRRREIIKLWDACNVPLEHRTYFFLLFKGEPSDAVYLEVEQRRLVFLREQFTNANNKKKDSKTLSLASRLAIHFFFIQRHTQHDGTLHVHAC